MSKYKKAYSTDVTFLPEYYVNGVDIFSDGNRRFACYVDVKANISSSLSKQENSELFLINGKTTSFEIVISKVRDFYLVSFLKQKDCNKAYEDHSLNKSDAGKNKRRLEKVAVENIKQNNVKYKNIIYSKDYKTRAIIKEKDGVIIVDRERLYINDEDFYFLDYKKLSRDNFYYFLDVGMRSFFDTYENARRSLVEELNSNEWEDLEDTEEVEEFAPLEQDESVKWYFYHKISYSFFNFFKYVAIFFATIILTLLVLTLTKVISFGIFGVLSGLLILFVAIFVFGFWKGNKYTTGYVITDEEIIFNGYIEYTIKLSEIEEVKTKHSLFDKTKGTIIVKLKNSKALGKLKHIPDVQNVFEIIQKEIEKIKK